MSHEGQVLIISKKPLCHDWEQGGRAPKRAKDQRVRVKSNKSQQHP